MPLLSEIIDRVLDTPHGETAFKVTEIFHDAGEECWWIGGSTRDMFLGKIPKEIDMATSARPATIQRLFPKNDASAAALGTVVVSLHGHTFEVTTFREDDTASDGRHPQSVRFGDRGADARRRDATVNAIYWNPISREVFDPCGGEEDMKERLVRFIGDPIVRIRHDALRLLRMVRLRAAIDGQYHPDTYKALAQEAKTVRILSGTRLLEELEKMLLLRSPERALEDLWELGVLSEVLPELHACKGVAQPKDFHHEGDVWDHLLKCTSKFTEDHHPDVRLATLFHDSGKVQTFALKERIRFDHHAELSGDIALNVLSRLQMPKARAEKIRWIIAYHMMMSAFGTLTDVRKAHWYFHPWFQELLQLFALDIAGTEPQDYELYDSIIRDYDEFLNRHPRPQKPLLSGEEVMRILGLTPGEEVGEALQELHEAQVKKEITTKSEAREFLRRSGSGKVL